MTNERASRIWEAVVMRARREGAPVSPVHACLACVEALDVSGAALLLTSSMKTLEPVYTTDSRVGEMEELQATLGQGPGIDALDSGMPMLVDDIGSEASTLRWPVFARGAYRIGVRAIYSLPLALGAISVGALDLYHKTPRQLGSEQLLDALSYADTALLLTLDVRSGIMSEPAHKKDKPDGPMLWHAEVHQAAGMVSAQLGISVLDALVRLRAHAYASDERLTDVARAVVERRLRFGLDFADQPRHDGKEGR